MQALDSFISSIPSFDVDIPISAILISARPPGDESTSDPSASVGASALKTWAGKQKANANLTSQKRARKTIGKSIGGIKINEPTPKTSASTPPSGPRRKVHSSRVYFLLDDF
jgi:hypothetical protein